MNLERAVEICKSSEITDNQLKNIVVDQDEREVNEVKSDSKKGEKGAKENPGKQRNHSIVEDAEKSMSPRNVQHTVKFATNANKEILTGKCVVQSQGTAQNKWMNTS